MLISLFVRIGNIVGKEENAGFFSLVLQGYLNSGLYSKSFYLVHHCIPTVVCYVMVAYMYMTCGTGLLA